MHGGKIFLGEHRQYGAVQIPITHLTGSRRTLDDFSALGSRGKPGAFMENSGHAELVNDRLGFRWNDAHEIEARLTMQPQYTVACSLML